MVNRRRQQQNQRQQNEKREESERSGDFELNLIFPSSNLNH